MIALLQAREEKKNLKLVSRFETSTRVRCKEKLRRSSPASDAQFAKISHWSQSLNSPEKFSLLSKTKVI